MLICSMAAHAVPAQVPGRTEAIMIEVRVRNCVITIVDAMLSRRMAVFQTKIVVAHVTISMALGKSFIMANV